MDKIRRLDLDHDRKNRPGFLSGAPVRKRSSGEKTKSFKKPILIIGLVLVAFFVIRFFSATSSVFRYVFSVGGPSFKQTDGRVNILLLGIGGGNHDGADLTDSIIVASYDLKTNNATLFSIPRDLWLSGINERINAAYEIGKANGQGLAFAEDKIDDILGIPIHYAVLMDFSGFSKAVDTVGGVDVDVPDTFDDYQYPIEGKEDDLCGWTQKQVNGSSVYVDPNGQVATDSANLDFACRYEHIHFDKGMMHMDGTLALKFVRSRHALGSEGSDFARSKRQQLVIQAFRNKALSIQTLANPGKIIGLASTFGDSFKTDIPQDQFLDFYSLAKKVKNTNSVVLGDLGSGKSLFINPPLSSDYGGAWVLIPPNGDFRAVMDFVKNTLNPPAATSSATQKQ